MAKRSATFWCSNCGAPHGGLYDDLCPDCYSKENPDEDVEFDDEEYDEDEDEDGS